MMMTKNMLSFRIFLITQTNTEMLNIVHVTEDAKNVQKFLVLHNGSNCGVNDSSNRKSRKVDNFSSTNTKTVEQ